MPGPGPGPCQEGINSKGPRRDNSKGNIIDIKDSIRYQKGNNQQYLTRVATNINLTYIIKYPTSKTTYIDKKVLPPINRY